MTRITLVFGTLSILFIALLAPTGCYYDNEEDLYGNTTVPCDTANMRFSVEIKSILETKCYKCHEGASPSSGIAFDTYDALKDYVTDGKLVDRTTDASAPMPPLSEGGLMPKCDQQKIQAWVNAGAPNN
jgi:uncharacterized membrane protein